MAASTDEQLRDSSLASNHQLAPSTSRELIQSTDTRRSGNIFSAVCAVKFIRKIVASLFSVAQRVDMERLCLRVRHAFAFLFFSARNLAHRAFVAFEIFAFAAADSTRFFTCVTSRAVFAPNAFAAARTPLN